MEMENVTLCFCITDDSVLLAEKKVGFGAGKLNGFGGKVKAGETTEEATLRELREESGLVGKAADLTQVALLNFYFQNVLRFTCLVYTLNQWTGTPQETAEMKKAELFKCSELPFGTSLFWSADELWLPHVLRGETITANIFYNAAGTGVEAFTLEKTVF